MHNLFLYAVRDSSAYRRVEEYLSRIPFNGSLMVLPPGTKFSSPICLELRSNDCIILFAETDKDIDELILLNNEYESFRIILIIKYEEQISISKLNFLSPRLIAYIDDNIEDVGKYIKNIFK